MERHPEPLPSVGAGLDFRHLFDSLAVGVVIHDSEGRVRYANETFARLLGYSLAEALSLTSNDVIHPDDRSVRNAEAAQLFHGHLSGAVVHRRLLRKDGTVVRARVRKSLTEIDGDRLVIVNIEAWSDVAALEYAARHDDLTGLFNRRGFLEAVAITHPLEVATIAMVDVDGLKSVNDTLGHGTGDELLAHVGGALASLPLPGAIAGRWAGDEFVVCASASKSDHDDARRRESLRRLITATVRKTGTTAVVRHDLNASVVPSVSVGVTLFDPRTEPLTNAVQRADQDMYQHKRLRRYRPSRRPSGSVRWRSATSSASTEIP